MQRDDSNSEYEESNQMDVEINTDGARLQCVDYNDGEVPHFSEHVKFIYHDLLKSDENTQKAETIPFILIYDMWGVESRDHGPYLPQTSTFILLCVKSKG